MATYTITLNERTSSGILLHFYSQEQVHIQIFLDKTLPPIPLAVSRNNKSTKGGDSSEKVQIIRDLFGFSLGLHYLCTLKSNRSYVRSQKPACQNWR